MLVSPIYSFCFCLFFFQAEDGIRDLYVTGVQTCALPICIRQRVGDRFAAEAAEHLTWLTARISALDRTLRQLLRHSPIWQADAAVLQSVRGVDRKSVV